MQDCLAENDSKTIDWLRFPLACAVVLLHAGEISEGSYGTDFYSLLRIVLSQGICRIAVPCFFLISGCLFFSRLDEWDTSVWLGKLKKRFSSLVIPYLLWNIVALVVGFAYGWLRAKVSGGPCWSLPETLDRFGWANIFWSCTYGCPIDYPLWFIRDLIIFVAISPLSFLIARKGGLPAIVALFILCGIPGSRDIEGFFYFTLGAWLRISGKSICGSFSKWKWPALIAGVAGIVLIALTYRTHPELYQRIKYLFVLCGTACVFNFTGPLVENGKVKVHKCLSDASFFIFASHGILILHDISHFIILHAIPLDGTAASCLKLFLKTGLAIVICMVLYQLMKKLFPKLLRIFTGGR